MTALPNLVMAIEPLNEPDRQRWCAVGGCQTRVLFQDEDRWVCWEHGCLAIREREGFWEEPATFQVVLREQVCPCARFTSAPEHKVGARVPAFIFTGSGGFKTTMFTRVMEIHRQHGGTVDPLCGDVDYAGIETRYVTSLLGGALPPPTGSLTGRMSSSEPEPQFIKRPPQATGRAPEMPAPGDRLENPPRTDGTP